MKLETKLILFLSIAILCANCDVISANKAELIPPTTTSPIDKSEFIFMETPLFNLKNKENKIDEFIEPSGIVAIDKGGEYLLVIDDKSDLSPNDLRVVKSTDGSILNDFQIPVPTEKPKWEALAKDENDYFVIGSHAGDTKKKIERRSLLYRFKLEQNGDGKYQISKTHKPLRYDITESLEKIEVDGKKIYDKMPPTANIQKAKIEGLAVKTIDGKKNLIIGFREPDSLVRVYSAEILPEQSDPVKLKLKPYFSFNAGKTGDGEQFKLSSLEYIAELKGFLVITSSETPTPVTVNPPIFHGNAMWYVSDEKIAAAQLIDEFKSAEATKIAEFQKDFKAEGISYLPNSQTSKLKFAIVYDNDIEDQNEKQKYVGKMQIVELTKNP